MKNLLAAVSILSCVLTVLGDSRPVKVVLLGGQSNMAGRGAFAELDSGVKARVDAVVNRVWVSSQGRPKEKLSYFKADKRGKEFGPELLMGVTLAEKFPDPEFLLIKTAVGGASLHGAWSPDWTAEKAKASEYGAGRQQMKLYADHLKSIRENLQALEAGRKAYEIIGMCWMQGEKDSRLELSATTYEENLKRLIAAYRNELSLPEMPFVVGQINCPVRGKKDFPAGPETVRQAMADVAAADPNTEMVATSPDPSWSDYPKKEDNVHYNAEGQRRLGIAFAEKLLQLKRQEEMDE